MFFVIFVIKQVISAELDFNISSGSCHGVMLSLIGMALIIGLSGADPGILG